MKKQNPQKVETILGIIHVLFGISWAAKDKEYLLGIIPVSSGIYVS